MVPNIARRYGVLALTAAMLYPLIHASTTHPHPQVMQVRFLATSTSVRDGDFRRRGSVSCRRSVPPAKRECLSGPPMGHNGRTSCLPRLRTHTPVLGSIELSHPALKSQIRIAGGNCGAGGASYGPPGAPLTLGASNADASGTAQIVTCVIRMSSQIAILSLPPSASQGWESTFSSQYREADGKVMSLC